MEKQKENIELVDEEALEQATGGVAITSDEQEKNQETPSRPQLAMPRFI